MTAIREAVFLTGRHTGLLESALHLIECLFDQMIHITIGEIVVFFELLDLSGTDQEFVGFTKNIPTFKVITLSVNTFDDLEDVVLFPFSCLLRYYHVLMVCSLAKKSNLHWSGRRESNPCSHFGKVEFYH